MMLDAPGNPDFPQPTASAKCGEIKRPIFFFFLFFDYFISAIVFDFHLGPAFYFLFFILLSFLFPFFNLLLT